MTDEMKQRLERFAGFHETDPCNAALLRDYASLALEANDCQLAASLFGKLESLAPLEGPEANAAGIAAMRAGNQEMAQQWYARALEQQPDDVNVRFNIAWSLALSGGFVEAREWLDEPLVTQLPQAAMLDLQLAHELALFDEAEPRLLRYLELHPDYPPLNAVASVLAMDLDRPDLAREAAMKAGDHPDALATSGTLELGERNLEEARQRFERSLALRAHNPRADIGLGLVELASGNPAAAAKWLDLGAEKFRDHLGSWLAAGWAYFIAGDIEQAEARFATALAHDDTFGEAHGSMAVVELLRGRVDEAKRRIEVARRLDRQAFSTAMASILWEQSHGSPERAEQIFRIALAQPIGMGGGTLVEELIRANTGGSSPARPTLQ